MSLLLTVVVVWIVTHTLFKISLAIYLHMRSVWIFRKSGVIECGNASRLMGIGAALEKNIHRIQDYRFGPAKTHFKFLQMRGERILFLVFCSSTKYQS
jgi:hypothetical protein